MTPIFLFGTLLDPELRNAVLGHPAETRPARLTGWRIERAAGGDWPILVPAPGGAAEGLLVAPQGEGAERMDFYEAAFDYTPETALAETGEGSVDALVYRAPGGSGSGAVWDIVEWQEMHGPVTRLAAREAMEMYGQVDPSILRFRMPMIRARAHSTTRAAQAAAPTRIRANIHRDRVEVLDHRVPYQHYFAVGETVLRHPTFDGGVSAQMQRAAFWMPDAVTVLPFDPVRRRVLLVEQFRYGPWLRGDPYPWLLEPVAGRVDPGETPETTARRETLEEARLELGALYRIGGYYPGPGAVSEYIDSFVGLADLPDDAATLAGLADEQEDIRSHVLPLDDALDLIDTGEAATGPLLLSLLWIDRALRRGILAPS